jgi:AmpD protein
MISQDGIIDVAEFCPSPNFDERPKNCNIDLLVIHAISLPEGNYNTQLIKDLFLNVLKPGKDKFLRSIQDLKVSSHFLITRKGVLIQFVPTHKRAWHAGISNYKGRENCNDFSIGIELEGCDDEEFENPQYQSLSRLINFLAIDLQVNKQNIVGHADIAPGRKTDPGPLFDWTLLESML